MVRVCHTVFSAHCSLVVNCWEMVNLLTLLCVIFSCVFVTCPGYVLGLVLSVHELCILPYFFTDGNVVRANRTVMQMKSLRDHPDMSYGSNKQWHQLHCT